MTEAKRMLASLHWHNRITHAETARSLMNSLWSFIDWILPPVQLSDDLDDPYAFSDDGCSVLTSVDSSPTEGRAPSRDWTRERERVREEELRRERERDRGKVQALERENATLHQRVSSLEHDLESARQSLATLSLLSSPISPTSPTSPTTPSTRQSSAFFRNPDAVTLRTSYDSLLSSYSVVHRNLQERTEEVASLKSFLSKNDEWSGAQLIQALHDLNAEIVQLAASVAEELAPTLDRRMDKSRPSDNELVTNALGPVMTNLLLSRDHMADPTLVQFAIQAWEVSCVGRVLDAFCFGLPEELNQILTSVFEHMHRTEPQPTTARWRALTHQHARTLLPSLALNSAPFPTLNESNLRGMIAILALSGCTDNKGIHRDPLRQRYGAALARISERAERIALAVKEGVMSGSFEVAWVGGRSMRSEKGKAREGEHWFDYATMENVYAGHGSEKSKVLCTVELGLSCTRRVGAPASNGSAGASETRIGVTSPEPRSPQSPVNGLSPFGSLPSNGAASSSAMTRSLLVKPKVLLESVADIF